MTISQIITNPLSKLLSLLEETRQNGEGWTAKCPAHDGIHKNSLSLHRGEDGRVLLKCFAGCTVQEIVAALGLKMRDLFPQSRLHLTVADLARDKVLPEAFLRELGVVEEGSALRLTYRLADGSPAPRQRIRTALAAKDGSIWTKGQGDIVPYGLWRLGEARSLGYLVLAEGESDCWTLWHHGIPALGIPGADMTGKIRAEYLAGIPKLFVVRETDRGGETFIAGTARQLKKIGWTGEARVIVLPNAKDSNDLHRQLQGDKEKFAEAWRSALEAAKPLPEPSAKGEEEANKRPSLTPEQIAQVRQELEKLQAEEAEEAARPPVDRKAVEEILAQALQSEDPIVALERTVVPALAKLTPITLDDAISKVVKVLSEVGHAIGRGTLRKEVKTARQKADQARGVQRARIENLEEDLCIHERQLADPEGQAVPIEGVGVEEEEEGDGKKRRATADRLIDYALADPRQTLLFCDQHGQPHVLVGGQPIPLTPRCYKWLRMLMVEHEEKSATGESLLQAAGTLAAKAETSGEVRELYVRSAWHDGALYVELSPGQVLRVDTSDWRLDDKQTVLFRRFANLKPLPMPVQGGNLNTLLELLPLRSNRDKRILQTCLVCGLLPHISRPILLATGATGSGKTTLHRIVKRLLDPTTPETIRLDPRDALQKASHCAVVLCDNLSHLADWQSDMICRWVTGEGDSKRVLFTDDDDFIVEIKRLVLLNGINPPADRADFQDRCLPIDLERISDGNRKPEEEIWAAFEREHAGWLGCLFDLLSAAMKLKGLLRLATLPRLADWGKWTAAVYEAAGWEEGDKKGAELFISDWAEIVERQQTAVLDGSTLAQVILAFMEGRNKWAGTPSDLLAALQEAAATLKVEPKRDRKFPQSPDWVWRRIREVLPLLVAKGIEAARPVRGKARDITLRTCENGDDGVDGDGSQENQASANVTNIDTIFNIKNGDDDGDDPKSARDKASVTNVTNDTIFSGLSGNVERFMEI